MTRRDLAWRGAGLAIFAGACAVSVANEAGSKGGSLGLIWFALAFVGVVLIIQGKRVPAALRIERSRHRELPLAIHARRRRRSGGASD